MHAQLQKLHANTDLICDLEDTSSTEEGEGEGEEEEEEEYAPDGLDWSPEQSSDYSSAEDGSEGSEGGSEGEDKLVWKEEKETGGMKIRQRKRLPKYLDDGDVSLYHARIR